MNPADFYHFAVDVFGNSNSQFADASYRTIVSRVYYAAMLAARDHGKLPNTGADVHKQVIEYWRKRKPALSNRLSDLKDFRNDADYSMDKNIGRREAGEAMKRAKQVLTDLGVIQ